MKTIRTIKRFILSRLAKIIYCFKRVQVNKIFFVNFSGNYDCNVKAICDELLNRDEKYEIVWAVFPFTDRDQFPKGIKLVKRVSLKYYKELMTSKIIIDNEVAVAFTFYKKRKGQYLIETWHGSLGIKKFGREANNDKEWFKFADKEAKMTDYIVSNSDFEDMVYQTTFWKDIPIWKFGHPRNDILFCQDKNKIEEVHKSICSRYGFSLEKKTCLYAPTFRDNDDMSVFNIDYNLLKEALAKKFGGEWVILTRFHSVTKNNLGKINLPESTIDISDYSNIEDILVVIDCGITDYSSWVGEFMLTNKPAFIFGPDYQEYSSKERALYFSYEELPFPSATSLEQLIDNIHNFDSKKYNEKCSLFLKKCGSVDDGNASKRVVKEINNLIKENA